MRGLVSRVTGLLLLVLASLASPTAAQIVEIPAFPVGPAPEPGWSSVFLGFGVGAAPDGGFAVAWPETHTLQNGKRDMWALVTEAFDTNGTSRGPATRLVHHDDPLLTTAINGFSTGYAAAFAHGEFPVEAPLYAHFIGLDGTSRSVVEVSEVGISVASPLAVASTPLGPVFAYVHVPDNDLAVSMFSTLGAQRGARLQVTTDSAIRHDVAGTYDGGFVVAFEGDASPKLRFFDQNGGSGPTLDPGVPGLLAHVAASPAGDVVAYGIRRAAPMNGTQFLVQRIDSTGALIGAEILVHEEPSLGVPELEFDLNGNLYTAWTNGTGVARARAFDRDGVALGPAVEIATGVSNGIRSAPLASSTSRFVNVWQDDGRRYANVVSLCTPGASTCGDGVFDAFCERCDDGAGNSDTTPDACRTTCALPRCGDGVTDGGEQCDDANGTACDGCTACQVDVGLGCGDGVAIPVCGETCDDGNTIVGDGCAPDCRLERAPGGGPAPTDCFTAWSIDNPANDPFLDKKGDINRFQECVDDDSRCDFDGGTPGSCTFHVRVCVNNTDRAACTPGTRLSSWTLKAPTVARALKDPIAAAQRSALQSAVLPNVVGPSERDLCSPMAAVTVPIRGGVAPGKLSLKTDASLYTGARDVDKLRLTCVPGSP